MVKETIKHGIVPVVLQETLTLRAMAYVYPDGDGHTELQRKLTPESEWATILTEPETVEEMRELTRLRKCPQCDRELIQNHCQFCEQRGQ